MRLLFVPYLVIAALAASLQAQSPPRLADSPDRFASVGDLRLRYRDIGRGDPIVLLHGRGGSLESLKWLADSLAVDHRVLAFDARGHGQSTKSSDPRRYGPAMADDVIGLLDHLGIASADVLGHSQGALVAAQVAKRRPERIGRLVLIAGPFAPDSATYAHEQAAFLSDLEAGRGFEGMYREQGLPDSVARAMSASRLTQTDVPSLIAVVKAQGGLVPTAADTVMIRTEALVIVGDFDERRNRNRALSAWWPRSHYVEVRGATHGSIMQHPAMLLAVRDFLSDSRTAPRR